jgi:hypothetical protein
MVALEQEIAGQEKLLTGAALVNVPQAEVISG